MAHQTTLKLCNRLNSRANAAASANKQLNARDENLSANEGVVRHVNINYENDNDTVNRDNLPT